MAYTPQNWNLEKPITPEALNYMEKGIGNTDNVLNKLKWSEPKLFNITSSEFVNNYPNRNYYIKCGNLVILSIWLTPSTTLNSATRYNIETDLPKPKEYHSTAGFFDHKFVHGTVFIDSDSQLRLFSAQKIDIGDSFCAQMFYTTNEE